MSSLRCKTRALAAVAAFAAAMLLPAYAHAATVTMGNPSVFPAPSALFGCDFCEGETYAQGFSLLTALDFAPAAGVIKSWRVAGKGTVELRVIEGGPEGGWIGRGTSAAATNLNGQPNATNLPIDVGDLIGVEFPGPGKGWVGTEPLENAERLGWKALTDDGMEREPSVERGERFQLNAEVVLKPVVSSISAASGSTTGGNAVKISGLYLDSATSVTFGATPAASFSVDSANQITAIAPPSGASTVDVRVSGPGGSSEAGAADKYTFVAPATTTTAATTTAPVTTTNTTPKTLAQGGPDLGPASPAVTVFSESAAKWRRGHSLPHISSAGAPVGTTFSFSLNEQATTTLTFTQSVAGRRAHGRCVVPSPANAHKAKCKRTVLVGSFGVSGRAGLNKVRFQGRLSSAKALKPGTYAVSITARDAHGLKAVSRSLSFTIVS